MAAFFSVNWFSNSEIRFEGDLRTNHFLMLLGSQHFLYFDILQPSDLILQIVKPLFNILYKRTEFLIYKCRYIFILFLHYVGCAFSQDDCMSISSSVFRVINLCIRYQYSSVINRICLDNSIWIFTIKHYGFYDIGLNC